MKLSEVRDEVFVTRSELVIHVVTRCGLWLAGQGHCCTILAGGMRPAEQLYAGFSTNARFHVCRSKKKAIIIIAPVTDSEL